MEVFATCDGPSVSSAIPTPAAGSPYEQVSVAAAPAVTVECLRDALHARAITEYAVVDHGHDMAAAGVASHPAWTLVFGNPAAGEKLLARDPCAAVDIPLRLAVIGAGAADSIIVIRPMTTLLPEAVADVAEALTTVLHSLAAAARDSAERRT
jgi:uncharacterized protein (DUF302 family)